MKKLYLNNREVDFKDKSIAISKQANDIGELRDSQAHFTNKFFLPFTPKNKIVLWGLGIIGSQSRSAYEKIEATYIDEGEDMIPNGYAIISKFKDGYACTIYDGNIFLFEAIGDKTMVDLDIADLSHDLTTAEFTSTFGNTGDPAEGHIYAISDFGNFDEAGIIINYQLPSFFVHFLLAKIFDEAGATVAGAIFTDPKHKELLITAKRGYISEEDAGSASAVNAVDSRTNFSLAERVEIEGQHNLSPDQTSGFIEVIDNTIIVTQAGNYSLDITLTDSFDACPSCDRDPEITIRRTTVYRNDTLIYTHIGSGSVNIGVYANVNDVITFRYFIQYFNGLREDVDGNFIIIPVELTFGIDVDFYTVLGGTGIYVNVLEFVGELTQKQFVKDWMQHFGLVMQKRRYLDTYDFVQRDLLIVDKINAEDWSDQFNKDIENNYKLDKYGQKNRFAYSYRDSEVFPYADGFMYLDNQTLPVEVPQLIRPYNAPELTDNLLNTKSLTFTPFWEAERDDSGAITSWKPLQGKNYFAKVEYNTETIYYKTNTGSLQNFKGVVPRLSFKGLDYQSLLDRNYRNTKQVLDWNNIKTTEFNLTRYEVKNVDFLKIKYARQLASYFILNKIKGYRENIAKCEIVLIPRILGTLTAKSGEYSELKRCEALYVYNLDGTDSEGYSEVLWTIVSKPLGAATPIFSDDDNILTNLTFVNTCTNGGDYVIRLTVWDELGSSTSNDTIINLTT